MKTLLVALAGVVASIALAACSSFQPTETVTRELEDGTKETIVRPVVDQEEVAFQARCAAVLERKFN